MPLRLAAVIALAVAAFAALSFYASRYLGLFPLGEVPPKADAYHLARSALALFFSVAIVRTVHRHRAADCALNWSSMPSAGGAAAIATLLTAIACVLLLYADPIRFAAGAQEDSPVEWISALLLLGGSALLVRLYLVRRAAGQVALLALLLALVFFTIGMEEISWLQRVIGFSTPEEIARANMQEEFNLHNVHTDLSENLYYVGAFAFLILLPFLRDALPAARGTFAWVFDYVPGRWVAAVAAPLSIFNYGMWNVIPMQMTMMLTVLVLVSYALAASARGARAETAIFATISVAVVAGQAAVLAAAHNLPNIWDPSEYKELFIAVGLFAGAGDLALRVARLRPPARCPTGRS
jgi:hypothetical protein